MYAQAHYCVYFSCSFEMRVSLP